MKKWFNRKAIASKKNCWSKLDATIQVEVPIVQYHHDGSTTHTHQIHFRLMNAIYIYILHTNTRTK